MNRLLPLILTTLLWSGFATAQKIKAIQLPAATKDSFNKSFPGVTARWEREKGNFEAEFRKDGKSISAVFTEKGELLETETGIAGTALPPAAVAYVKTHYPGATIHEAAQIRKPDGSVTYEAEVNKMDLLFDKDGNFLKTAKD